MSNVESHMPFHDLIGHERPTAVLKAALAHDRVAHAYLFYGEAGIGKRQVAIRFAQAINCDTEPAPDGPDACGACRSCRQIERLTHPDCLLIVPDPDQANPQIKIERIRELDQQLIYRPLIGRRKVCLIDEADRMTIGATNALLKTLEEPPDHSLLVLISSRPYALPATIRSRCQHLRFSAPARAQVESALTATRQLQPEDARFLALVTRNRIGEALRTDLGALRAQQDEFGSLLSLEGLRSVVGLLTAAETLYKADRAPEALEWTGRWLRDLLLVRLGADPDSLVNRDRLVQLKETAAHIQPEPLLDLLDILATLERSAARNLNLQLALENILLRLRDAVTSTLAPDSTRS